MVRLVRIKKAIEISDARIEFVSLVDRPANGRRFLIAKNGQGLEGEEFLHYGRIVKVDEESHFITGIVYEPFVEDAQGNFMTDEEIRKAAHWFSKNGDKVDVQHSFQGVDGVFVVENYVAPCDMEVGGEKISKGTWLMTVEVINSDVWQAVKKGKINGFSMGGFGCYAEGETYSAKLKARRGTDESFSERSGILKRFAAIFASEGVAGKNEEQKGRDEELTREEVQEMIDESIENALRNLQKSRGLSTNLDDEGLRADALEKNEGHFLRGLI